MSVYLKIKNKIIKFIKIITRVIKLYILLLSKDNKPKAIPSFHTKIIFKKFVKII